MVSDYYLPNVLPIIVWTSALWRMMSECVALLYPITPRPPFAEDGWMGPPTA